MAKNIDKVVRRTYRYFYDDGLVEMSLGACCLWLWVFGWSFGMG